MRIALSTFLRAAYVKIGWLLFVCALGACGKATTGRLDTGSNFIEQDIVMAEPAAVELNAQKFPEANEQGEPHSIPVRKLIKEGEIGFEVDHLDHTRARIDSVLKRYQGYISSEKENTYGSRFEQTLVIRIPFEHFDRFLREVTDGVSRLDHKDIRVKDVTEEYLDVQARLKTKKELEERYLELLGKANSVSEILAVEREINQLRGDIESFEGRLQYLVHQSQWSTLTLTFYKTTSVSATYGSRFVEGLSDGWKLFASFIIGMVHIWPFLLIIASFIVWISFRWRKRRSYFKEHDHLNG